MLDQKPSDGVEVATPRPRLAAAEDPALASPNNKLNGLSYNEAMVESIPSRGSRGWLNVVAEWKWFAAMLTPFFAAIFLYFIPASQGQLESVKKDAAASLEIVKASQSGQNEAVKAQIGALQLAIGDIKAEQKEARNEQKEARKEVQEVLKLLQGSMPPSQYAAAPPPPQDTKPSKVVRKQRPVAKPEERSWLRW